MKLRDLSEPIVAVVQLANQARGVIHQVFLDPAKLVKSVEGEDLIRLGLFPGDEANGWQYLEAIAIVYVLGKATYDAEKKQITVTPYPD